MSEFNIQAESVDVERIMEQIRARVREKRGVDYTEEQIREMAGVKLERFLDPKNVRSDLIEHYRRQRQADQASGTEPVSRDRPPLPPSFAFEPDIIYRSSRGAAGRVLYAIRRMLNPVLKLFFNPTPLVHAVHVQSDQINLMINFMVKNHMEFTDRFDQIAAKLDARAELDALTYELLNNLVVEMTRLSIDVKNHRMRVESIAGRLDFDERRARALESVVQYRSASDALAEVGGASPPGPAGEESPGGVERKRRRRRRGRRRAAATPPSAETPAAAESQATGGAGAPSSTPPDAAVGKIDAPGPAASTASDTPAPKPAEPGGERRPSGEQSPTPSGEPDPSEP